ncbi:hypothetical protein D0439_22430 [Lysinibacillus fusiformis]|nr:vicilin family protein [Lysinibacillus fusiformis]QEA01237.1 hypothetical protein D0439_22430 [Lysinibacillus fusiformis]
MKKTGLLLSLLLSISLLSLSSSNDDSEEGRNADFFFGEESFEYQVKSEHGAIKTLKVLPHGFTNYRIGWIEIQPLTFITPNHLDADSIFYVLEGSGAVSMLHEGSRESHSLEKGDIIKVWAGSIVYMINKCKDQKLKIVKLLQPVGGFGMVEAFYSSGREESESYYQSFSIELLEAALNSRESVLEQFFGKQRREAIVKASEEKIRAIAAKQSSKPFSKSKSPFNLLNKKPSSKNNRGQLLEADQRDYELLKDLNARVSYANITKGSMMLPFFNTRAFKIALIERGSGYVEMICPQVASSEEEPMRKRYRKLKSPVSEGMVFVTPPGHPIAIVAGREESLEVFSFEVLAENNELVYVAGKDNILGQMDSESKELSFGAPEKVVDEVLRGGEDEVFVAGPEERERKEKSPLQSFLKSVSGF